MGRTLSRLATRLSAVALLAAAGATAAAEFDHRHAAWTALLRPNVVVLDGGRASRLRYAGLARDRAALQSYLAALSAVEAREFGAWNKAQRLAFLINAYNAHMAALVLTRHPGIESVWDFGKLLNNPFKRRFFMLLGRETSLDDIEHGLIRAPGAYDDPRIHFAVNCASLGCPMLREEAYRAADLDAQLDEQTVRFLSDRARNRVAADGALEVSSIFKWYGGDFSRGGATLADFFARHAALLAGDDATRQRILEKRAPLRFLDYDWRLNGAP
jgi:hypothetical protein